MVVLVRLRSSVASAARSSILNGQAASSTSRKVVRALFDFLEQDEGDELTFCQGDLIEMIQSLGDGWALGRKLSGTNLEVGLFPESFVETVSDKGFKASTDPLETSVHP